MLSQELNDVVSSAFSAIGPTLTVNKVTSTSTLGFLVLNCPLTLKEMEATYKVYEF